MARSQYNGARPGLSEWFATPQGPLRARLGARASSTSPPRTCSATARCRWACTEVDFLRANRIPFRFTLALEHGAALAADPMQLPLASQSVDLVVLPHALESTADPHLVLREAERVLIPEGQLVISGFNPLSLWRLRQLFARKGSGAPWDERFIGLLRLKDWLHLLGFELNGGRFGCYAPPFEQPALAVALRVHGEGRRALVADHGRRLRGARGEARARHAPDRARLAQGARAPARAGGAPAAQRPPDAQHDRSSAAAMTEAHVEIYADGACKGNPGPGGWGVLLRSGRPRAGTVRRRGADHQQPHGADRGDRGPACRSRSALEGARLHRLAVRAEGHHRVDPQLEAARLAHRRQEAGEERGPVAQAGRGRARARRRVALGEGPRRPSGERARRCARQQGHSAGASGRLAARQIVLDTETTGLQREARRPRDRDRLHRAAQPQRQRAPFPPLRQSRSARSTRAPPRCTA